MNEQQDLRHRPGESFIEYDRRIRRATRQQIDVAADAMRDLTEEERCALATIKAALAAGTYTGAIPQKFMPFIERRYTGHYEPATAHTRHAMVKAVEASMTVPAKHRTLATDEREHHRRPMSQRLRQALSGFQTIRSDILDTNAKRLGFSVQERLALAAEALEHGILLDQQEDTALRQHGISPELREILDGQAVPMTVSQFHARCRSLGYDGAHATALTIEGSTFGKVRHDDDEDSSSRIPRSAPLTDPRRSHAVEANGRRGFPIPGTLQAMADASSIWFDEPAAQRKKLRIC